MCQVWAKSSFCKLRFEAAGKRSDCMNAELKKFEDVLLDAACFLLQVPWVLRLCLRSLCSEVHSTWFFDVCCIFAVCVS